jgi:CRP-like cAMP-binding protein
MPGVDGYAVCRQIREFSHVPIVMVTAKGGVEDKVKGLECGADDFVTKPFSAKELVAWIKAVLRRTQLGGEPGEALYFVVSGVVKVFKTSTGGREQVLRLVPPGESFNEVAVFDGGPNPASASTLGPVVLACISRDDLTSLLERHHRVAVNIIMVLAVQLRHLVSLVEGLAFRQVHARLAKLLLGHVQEAYASEGSPRPHLT